MFVMLISGFSLVFAAQDKSAALRDFTHQTQSKIAADWHPVAPLAVAGAVGLVFGPWGIVGKVATSCVAYQFVSHKTAQGRAAQAESFVKSCDKKLSQDEFSKVYAELQLNTQLRVRASQRLLKSATISQSIASAQREKLQRLQEENDLKISQNMQMMAILKTMQPQSKLPKSKL